MRVGPSCGRPAVLLRGTSPWGREAPFVLSCGLALASALATGCVARRCPPNGVCGEPVFSADRGGFGVDGRGFRLPLTFARGVGGAEPPTDRVSVRRGPTLLHFDFPSIDRQTVIEHATLSLMPHVAWRPRPSRVAVYAFGVLTPFTVGALASGHAPELASAPAGFVDLPANARVPVRVDVTGAVRAWLAGTGVSGGLALTANTDDPLVFQGPDASDARLRPRLEVVLR